MSKRKIFKQDEFPETGFGNKVIEPNQRLMNKDGSGNVKRLGNPVYSIGDIYHALITMKWWKFFTIIILSYFTVNLLFAFIYYFGDNSHVNGMMYNNELEKFMEIFFFSSQSLTTVGYGRLNPSGMFDSTVATIESMVGVLSFAIATGLLYGRFSRPVANIRFSDFALIAPYEGVTALMVRLGNKNKSELLNPEATIVMAYVDKVNGNDKRKFISLKLELTRVTLLTLTWTLVHPIDEESPLYGWTTDDYKEKSVEFLVMLHAYEETFAQTVHARNSYTFDEIIFGARFTPIVSPGIKGSVIVDLNRINEHEEAPLHEEIFVN